MEDTKLAGFGRLSGGEYRKVEIMGGGLINGVIKAEEISVMGSGNFSDVVISNIVKANGNLSFNKELTAEEIYINGLLTCNSKTKAKLLRINGKAKIRNDLNVGFLRARLDNSSIKNIYGDSINIKSKKKISTISTIEANTIELVNIKAEKVSGNTVSILGRSSVGIVEYQNSLIVGPQVKIKKVVHV